MRLCFSLCCVQLNGKRVADVVSLLLTDPAAGCEIRTRAAVLEPAVSACRIFPVH